MPTIDSSVAETRSYSIIFDLTPFPMWIYDLDNLRFLAVNKEAMRHYGYTKKEFLSMTLKDIRPKEEIPKMEKAIEKARYRVDLYKQSLFKHQKKDGSIIRVQLKGNLIDFLGKKAEIVTAVDLTDRYLQEKHIEKQKRYLSTIGTLNEILLKSNDWAHALKQCFEIVGRFLDVHSICFFPAHNQQPALGSQIGWVHEKNNSQNDHPEQGKIPFFMLQYFMDPLEKGKFFEAIVSDLPPSGTKDDLIAQNVVSFLVLPVMVTDNFLGHVRVDDCKSIRKWQENDFQLLKSLTSNLGPLIKEAQAHQKLMESEARFRSLVQNGTDLTAIVNSRGDYKYVSPTSMNVLGIPPEEFLGKNGFDFIYEEDAPRVRKCFDQILEKKRVSIEPYRFQDTHKKWRWIQTELSNHLADPAIEGIIVNSREVTVEVDKRRGELLLGSLTKMICQPGSLASCLTQALKKLIELSKINVGEVWLVSEDKSHLHLISKSCQDKKFEAFYQDPFALDTMKKGKGFPGHIWKVQKSCRWDNLPSHKNFPRSSAAGGVHLQTALGIPIIYNDEFLGCIICFSQHQELSDKEKLLTEIGLQIGPVVKQKIIEEEYRTFFNISPDPQCILGFDGLLKKFNNAFIRLLGYEEKELKSKPFLNFLHQEDRAEYEARLKASIKGESPKSFEGRFLTKKGDVKWLIWNGTIIPEGKIIIAAAKDITEQKNAEQSLINAYERLKTAQKIAKLGYWVRDLDAEFSEWNEEVYNIYGYTPANFIPTFKNVIQTFHPDDRHLIESDVNEHLVPGEIKSFENRILTASNEVKWVRQEIRLLADDKNVPYRIEGTIQDITEKKEYELQLTLSNERFQLAMKASNEMIWEIDCQNKKIIRSKGYEKSILYESSEPFNKSNSWFKRIYPKDVEAVWHSLQDALQNKEETTWNREYRMFTVDGSLAYFMDRCFILRDDKGLPLQCVGSALDVTASKQQLEKIKKQNKSLREIAWLQSHVIRAPLARIMGLIYLAKEHNGGGKPMEEICDLVSVSAEELDKVIHEIIQKTDTLKENESTDFTH